MTFLAPYMLFGAAAAGIPIALHFFFRSRYRTVPWAAMKFLLTSIEQTSRRLRFQELLLLLVRCLVLLLLALAFARPLSSVVRGAGRGDAVGAVFVLGPSGAMGARDGSMARLERAKEAALKVIDQLPSHSTVQVIACADRASLLGPRSPANLDQAKSIVEKLKLTSLATDLFPGIVEAEGILERGQASNRELYLFSDMQKLGWEQQTGDLAKRLQDIKEKATVFLVRCGTRKVANAALIGITPQSGLPRPGERVGFAVLVRNTSSEPVKGLKVSLSVDGKDKYAETQTIARIDPSETRTVTLNALLEKAGLHVLTAKIGHDDLEGDNRFDRVILVRDRINILVVDGNVNEREPANSSSYYLMHGLLPITESQRKNYKLEPRLVTPRLASPALLAKTDLCILVNVALQPDLKRQTEVLPADFVEELARFVKQGHGLIVYAGDNVAPEPYNRILGSKHGLLPLPIKKVNEVKKPLHINRHSAALPAYMNFKEDDYYKDFSKVEVFRSLELEQPAMVEVPKNEETPKNSPPADKTDKEKNLLTIALRYDNDQPAVVSKKVDAGEVLLITTAAELGFKADSPEPTWTDWSIHQTFPAYLDVTINHLLHGQTRTYNVVAGEKLDWYPTEKQERAYTLIHPDGTNIRLGMPQRKDNRSVVTALDLSLAGIYHMVATLPPQARSEEILIEPQADKDAGTPIAVVPDLRESQDLDTLGDPEIDQRLGFQPIHITAGLEGPSQGGADRLNREWTSWFLLAVLMLAVGEALLAFWCGRAW